jgi:magnesium-transporting ATPase (P-type)
VVTYIIFTKLEFLGLSDVIDGINSNIDVGLTGDDFEDRDFFYGSNMREPPKRTPFCKLFIGALEDFMLRILLLCAVISISFDMGFAEKDELKTGIHNCNS